MCSTRGGVANDVMNVKTGITQMLRWYVETSDKYLRIVSNSFTVPLTF